MEKTLVIIKPDGVKKKLVGRIIQRFEDRGLSILKMYQGSLEKDLVEKHYEHLEEKPFFNELISYMTSGPVVFILLQGENVIQITRKMIGVTNAMDANPGTIRGDFAVDASENIIHASDSEESAKIEIERFFKQ